MARKTAYKTTKEEEELRSLRQTSTKEKVAIKEKREKKVAFYLLIGFILTLAAAFNFYHLTKFLTPDEEGWLVIKIPNFFQALTSFNWHNLLISDKPGITVAWLVKAGSLFTDQSLERFVNKPQLLLWARLPLIFANIGLLFWLTLLVKKATNGSATAILFLALTATNPTIRGMTAIVNPDSISWFFPLGFLLAFYLYLKKQQATYLWQSAVIFATGTLTKFTFVIVLPFLLLFLPTYYLFNDTKQNYLKTAIKAFFKVYILSFFLSLVLWPYLIIAPQQYLFLTFLKPLYRPVLLPTAFLLVIYYLYAQSIEKKLTPLKSFLPKVIPLTLSLLLLGLSVLTFKLTPHLPSVPKGTKVYASFSRLVVNNFYYHLYSQTTLTLLLYLLALVLISVFIWQKKENGNLFFVIICLFFITAYLLGSALVKHQTSPRYQISIYPFVSLLTAITASFIPKTSWQQKMGFAFFLAVVNALLLLPFAPYYLLYHNNLLPLGKLVFDGWGLGGYEAAQYLNKKPNAKNLTVYASYEGFEQFFAGRTVLFTENPFKKRTKVAYLVIFKQGEKKILIGNNKKKNTFWRYKAPAEFQFVINKVPVVKVVKVTNFKN